MSAAMMGRRLVYAPVLGALARERGVLACLLVDERDGVIVDAAARHGVNTEAVAALAASLYRRARLSSEAAGLGPVGFLRLRAEKGHVCAAGREELVIVTVAEANANIGLIRVGMLRALDQFLDAGRPE